MKPKPKKNNHHSKRLVEMNPNLVVGKNHGYPVLAKTMLKVMKENQWGLTTMAKRCKLSPGHISRLISGRRDHSPTLRSLELISNVCQTPAWKLIKPQPE